MNDLHQFDLATSTWTDLSSPLHGSPPTARSGHGMLSLGRYIYVFGGEADQCEESKMFCDFRDLRSVEMFML